MTAPVVSKWSSRLGVVTHYYRRGRLLRYLTARALVASGLSTRVTFRHHGSRLRFYPSAMSVTLWTDPADRHSDEEFFDRYLRAGDAAVDVGANIGHLTLLAATIVGPEGRVAAVEAHPRTSEYLRGNLALNAVRHVDLHAVAVGDTRGTVAFSDIRSDDQNAVMTANGPAVQVPLVPLDELALPGGPIALLKVDVEGYEEPVFRGAPATLARTACVLFESWERHCQRYGRRTQGAIDVLQAAGFTVLKLADARAWRPVPPDYVSERCENLVAVRDVEDFRRRWDRPG